jgi:hypothetical protein
MSFNGTVVGSPTFGPAKFGNGLTVMTDSDYISLPAGLFDFGTTNPWTIECWLKIGSPVFKLALSCDTVNAIYLCTDGSGNFSVSLQQGGGPFSSGVVISDGAWHHVAVTNTGGSTVYTIKMYVDGVFSGSPVSNLFNSPGPGAIGNIGRFAVAGGFAWPGSIDEIAFWNVQQYTVNFTPPVAPYTGSEPNLRALYHLQADGTDSAASSSITAGVISFGEYGPTTVALTWAVPSGGTAPYTYQVQQAPDVAGSPGTFVNVGAPISTLAKLITGLTASTQYWWRVVVTDSLSNTGTSPEVTLRTLAAGIKYNRLDAVAPAHGQNILILVPNVNSAVPYAGHVTTMVMYFHGAGEDQTALVSDSLKTTTVDALANAGYIMCGTNAHGGSNWGNQVSVDDYPDLFRAVLNAGYNIGKVVYFSQSMGGMDGLTCLSQQRIPNVIAWFGIYPACNLANIYSLGVFTSAINTAYGITGVEPNTYANQTSGYDPVLSTASFFRAIWFRFYASPGDTVVPKAMNSDVMSALVKPVTPESTVVVCSGNHGDPSHFQPADILAFIGRALLNEPAAGTTLLAKIRTAAAADFTLQAFLGTNPFRWYDQQLAQGSQFPAVAAFAVSGIPTYSNTAILTTQQYRVQLNIFDLDPQKTRQIASYLRTFFTTFNPYSPGGQTTLQPNRIVNERDGGISQTAPFTALTMLDVMIFNTES